MNIKKIEITSLKEAEYNPRIDLKPGDIEYNKIKNSILEFGYVTPIIINADMTVIGGHQRLKILKELGYKEIECVIVNLNKTKEKVLNIALNKISGNWDQLKLENLLDELINASDIDIELTGFETEEIQKMLKEAEETMNDNIEVDINSFRDDSFQCKCPKCGFVFDIKN